MKNRNYKEQESGACRRSAAHLEAHHRPTTERHKHDTLRRACCSLAVRYSFESGVFQGANRLPMSIVAKSARGGAGNFREREGVGVEVKVRGAIERSEIAEGLREQWNWQ